MKVTIPVAGYRFHIKARDKLRLPPYKGSTLRGAFGNTFKRVVCTIRGTPCPECILYRRCVYSYIFETPPPEGSEILRRYTAIPHPFVLEPPLDTRTDFLPGEELECNLILIGRAIDYLPYFVYTFEEMCRRGLGKGRGRCVLDRITHDGKTIYLSSKKRLTDLPQTSAISFDSPASPPDTIRLRFITPTRLKFNNDLVLDLEFHHLIRNLLRRVSSLSYFHCGRRLDTDFKGMIERAEQVETIERELKWHDWERYSSRQDTRMKLGGFTGIVEFNGDVGEFIPILRIGESIHVGKGTSFGLGKYEILETL